MPHESIVDNLWQMPLLILAACLLTRYGGQMTKLRRDACFGLVLGGCSVLMMLLPIAEGAGIILAIQHFPIAMAAAMIDPIAAVVALVPAILVRAWLGGEVWAGVLSLVAAAVAGGLWRELVHPHVRFAAIRLPMLGLMVSLHLVGMALLPAEMRWEAFTLYAPQYLLLNFLATVLFGTIVKREVMLAEYVGLVRLVRGLLDRH